MLSPKFYAGACYQLTKGIGLGALTRLQLKDDKLYTQGTASLILTPFRALNFSISYTMADRVYDNFGFGLAMKFGFLQYYLLCERIPLFYNKVANTNLPIDPLIPAFAKNVNFHTGVNIALGYTRNRKLLKDKALVEE